MKSRRRSYLVESDISVISIISRETNRGRQTCNRKMGWRRCSVYQRLACRRRWDSWPPQISLSEMRWAPIFEFFEMSSDRFWENFLIVWAVSECGTWTKMSFPFCILILDFISRVGNVEISSINGCHRMRWKVFKFGGKISTGV